MDEASVTEPAPEKIAFRRLGVPDLPLIHAWLNAPHVARWWYDDVGSYEEVSEKYTVYIEGEEPVEPYLILYGDFSIGYMQTYRISDDEEYDRLVDIENSVGVDLFIGEKEFLHKGLGAHVLRRFLREIVFAGDDIEICVIGPGPENLAAIRAYERVGFRYFKKIQVPDEPESEYLMSITRKEAMT